MSPETRMRAPVSQFRRCAIRQRAALRRRRAAKMTKVTDANGQSLNGMSNAVTRSIWRLDVLRCRDAA
jgi:hypothetical protein